MMKARYDDPLGCGLGSSRFSDPRLGLVADKNTLFKVVYLTDDLGTAFEETILRDRTDGRLPPYALTRAELEAWCCVELVTTGTLRLVDLRTSEARRALGIPTDAVRALDHRAGQRASFALHAHRLEADGIAYLSRLNDRNCLAVFDRALDGLTGACLRLLLDYEIGPTLRRYDIAVAPWPMAGRTLL